MPISRDEYEIGEIELSLYVLQFLRENSDYAFNADELLSARAASSPAPSRDELVTALEGLVESNRVESKTIKGTSYYKYYKRPLGFRPG